MGQAGGVRTKLSAPAKLTVSLRVTGRRADGYHTLDAEFVAIDLADQLVVDDRGDGLDVDGPHAARVGDAGANLVTRALAAVGRRAHVRLTKRIPPGGGLGGGSADAGAVLRWAGCDDVGVAAALGADVPFCAGLAGGRARVGGIGDELHPLPFVAQAFTLLTPPFGVSTAAVYAAWDGLGGPTGDGPNDLEPAALAVEPRLAEWRDRLARITGRTPTLAGSGSTWVVAGEFPGDGGVVVRAIPSFSGH
jgi:4-diphosphocytidyl-2-C-methyl-D-erythritol kinase